LRREEVASHHKTTVYAELPVGNPFDRAEKAYGDLLANERKGKNRWRVTAFISQGIVVLCVFILWYAVTLPETVPLIITVAPWGEAEYRGNVSGPTYKSAEIPEIAIQYQVREFVTEMRSISSDSEILYQNITRCYARVTEKCGRKMTAALREEDPFSLVGKEKRTVTIESILRLSTHTWQVDWIENTSGTNGGNRRMRGVFTVELLEPSAKQRTLNPLGIYVDDYDYTAI
jgi:type IV secretion system protein VirB5